MGWRNAYCGGRKGGSNSGPAGKTETDELHETIGVVIASFIVGAFFWVGAGWMYGLPVPVLVIAFVVLRSRARKKVEADRAQGVDVDRGLPLRER
ncbi:hypothetical protein CKO28_14260 [Rhodovibrio sodomensis]|uniref:Uncharacterized protein n=1 Tax=Rhodovibrio sodomensis TaxID=1088 RepID=A0ABS1DGG3_9PROT|nr:hypothetical protein [Rhodovibrio sodomensis]MBK1669197.1 hypothetical protein [Rhodovibrio sodomensis]